MNKNLFLGMFAAAGMLFATSCSNDELDVVQSGNEAQVSFSLGLEGGIATRAISDGKSADVLVYAVFDKDGNRLSTIDAVIRTGVTFPTTESIALAKGQTYKVAFWAQDADCKAYTVDTDKMSVAVNYANDENKVNNDETRDAFFRTVEFTVTGSASIDVEMKRPFAQINVGVTKEDWEAAVASGIEIGSSSVVIKNAATSLNLLDGTVEGSTEVSYALNAIPNDPAILKVDANGDGEDEEYNWLSMSYILPAAEPTGYEKATLENIAFVFAPKDDSYSNIEFNQGLNSVPVQRNWRTNILGKILTGDIQFNITIDPVYDDDYIYPDGTDQELDFVTAFGGTYTVSEDKTIDYLEIKEGANVDVTVNIGKDATLTSGSETNYGLIAKSGTLTINGDNGKIDSKGGGIGVTNGANLVFNGGALAVNTTSTSGRYNFYVVGEGSSATINGGDFSFNKTLNQKRAYIYAGAGATVYVKGGTFGAASKRDGYTAGIMGDGTVVITGGTFGFDPTKWVPTEGYSIIKDGDKYIVVEGTWAEGTKAIISSNLSSVATGGIFVMAEDIEVTKGNIIQTTAATSDITINGNGKTINSVANSATDFNWDETGTIPTLSTIFSSTKESNATITVNDLNFTGEMQAISLGHYVDNNSNWYNTIMNNVNVIDTKVCSFSSQISPAVVVYGKAELNNCNIYGTTLSDLDTDPMWTVYDLAVVNYSTTTINGGKIGSIHMWNQAEVTIAEQTEVEKIVIRGNMNTTKYGLKIKAGTTVGTIDLSAITNKAKVNITIESGATVSSIIANGTTYESIEAFQAS